ncbi:hypothetical protein [Campylobacter jejuni]|uniref:Uncharacterized protein n=1 Tax=Campylobacter jejuni TaxID=197 RepID=A0A431EEE3_CAMJU|nr:hypothetical protein [Campylobacter jejuni]RTJ79627.1 hypothetical protein C3H57_04450 [Campylobacter jejuni]
MSRNGDTKVNHETSLDEMLESLTKVEEEDDEIVVSASVVQVRCNKDTGIIRVILTPEVKKLLSASSMNFIYDYIVEYIRRYTRGGLLSEYKHDIPKEVVKDIALDVQYLIFEHLLRDEDE